MAWVDLNDVYVPKTGGTVTGNLEVDGTLTLNDNNGGTATVGDYVVERIHWSNSSGRDVYWIEKWASGFCRATGRVTRDPSSTTTTSTSYGNIYYTYFENWGVPPYFTEISYHSIQPQSTSGGLIFGTVYSQPDNLDTFSWYFSSARNMDFTNLVVNVCFEGSWK